jgi:hypothetical protein
LGSLFAHLMIALQRARDTVRIGFWEYARAGVPLTVASLVAGALILSFNGR